MRLARPLQLTLVGLLLAALAWWSVTGYTPVTPPAQVPNVTTAFDGQRAWKDLDTFVRAYPFRVMGNSMGQKSAQYLAEQFRSMGMEPYLHYFTGSFLGEKRTLNGVNVYGISPGAETGTILFTAHRDVVPQTVDGAVDDGSGVAAVMELARVLSQSPHRYTYVFAALDGEEFGLHGARALDFDRPAYLKDIRLVVNMDMIGFRPDGLLLVRNTEYLNPEALPLLQRAVTPSRAVLPTVTLKQPSLNFMTDADQFRWANMPIVDLLDVDPRGYAHYHKATDTMEYVLPDQLQRVGRAVEELVRTGDALGAFKPSAGLVLSRYRHQQYEFLPPWRLKLAGAAVLLILLLPAIAVALRLKKGLLKAFRTQWLPLGITILPAVLAYMCKTPWIALGLSVGLVVALRVWGIPDSGLGHFLAALAPAFFFACGWWATGQWLMLAPFALAVWVLTALLTWRPTWLWRTADTLLGVLLLLVAFLPNLIYHGSQLKLIPQSFAKAPPSLLMWGTRLPLFSPSDRALLTLCFTAVLLAAVWSMFARRPPLPAEVAVETAAD